MKGSSEARARGGDLVGLPLTDSYNRRKAIHSGVITYKNGLKAIVYFLGFRIRTEVVIALWW